MWVLGVLNSLFGQSGSGSLNEGEESVLLNNGKLVVANLLDIILWSVAGVVRVQVSVLRILFVKFLLLCAHCTLIHEPLLRSDRRRARLECIQQPHRCRARPRKADRGEAHDITRSERLGLNDTDSPVI